MEEFKILTKALEKAQQAGVFSLQDSVVVVNALNEVNKDLINYHKLLETEVKDEEVVNTNKKKK